MIPTKGWQWSSKIAKGTEEYKRLIESLEDFGLQRDKSKILENSFSKIQRDVVKMFDIKNTIL